MNFRCFGRHKCYYRSIDAHQNHRVENIRWERPRVPIPTFVPTLIPAAFVPLHFRHKVDTRLPTWLGGCDQANAEREEAVMYPPEQVGRTIKSEKDVFRSEIVCWLSTSSLTSQRGRRAAKRQRGRQVRASHAPAHLRAKILLTANTSTEHNRIHPTQRTTGLREYFRVHRHKYEKYPGFYSPSTLRPPARTNISYNRCPTMSRWQRGFSHSKFLPLFLDEGVRKLC